MTSSACLYRTTPWSCTDCGGVQVGSQGSVADFCDGVVIGMVHAVEVPPAPAPLGPVEVARVLLLL